MAGLRTFKRNAWGRFQGPVLTKRPLRGAWCVPGPGVVLRLPQKGGRHDINLGDFIDTYREAISQRVVESYPPLYRPSENGGALPRLLRTPLGTQADAIRGAALSLKAHRGTTVVGEMGTGKTFSAPRNAA